MANINIHAMNLVGVTATTNGADQINLAGSAAHVIINITTLTGTAPTATFTVQGKIPSASSATYYTILASTAIAATGTTILKIGAALTASANAVANDIMPRDFRVIMTAGGTITNLTATVDVQLVN